MFELILTITRLEASLDRWQSEFLAMYSKANMTPSDLIILNMIRLHDRPKSVLDISRILNRDDIPNIHYSIRKLHKAELIEKQRPNKVKGLTYKVTDEGKDLTDRYARTRKQLINDKLPVFAEWKNWVKVTHDTLTTLHTIYDMAGSYLATHRLDGKSDGDDRK